MPAKLMRRHHSLALICHPLELQARPLIRLCFCVHKIHIGGEYSVTLYEFHIGDMKLVAICKNLY